MDARILPIGLFARGFEAVIDRPFAATFSLSTELIDCELGNGDMGAQGLTGTGVGCVWRSAGFACTPGSRKEKKLCESECLWWWPRRDAPADDGIAGDIGDADEGGRAPNVKPSRNVRCPGPGDALGIGTPSSDGGPLKSSSCAPSSAMVVAGSEPGRGKYTDRLRECMRECLRGGTAFAVLSTGELSSGAVCEADILFTEGIASCCAGKDAESGEGVMGEKGPDTDRVREWELEAGREKD